jgi:hypothetical protein
LQNNGKRNYANYWFYLGPSEDIVMVYGKKWYQHLHHSFGKRSSYRFYFASSDGLFNHRSYYNTVSGVTSVDQVQSAFNTSFWIFGYNSQRVIRLRN